MAFIDLDSVNPTGATFYNVNEQVGYGSKNMVEDVKIVQFFLQRYFECLSIKKPWGEMTPDGKCGPITRAWIIQAQLDMRRAGTNVMADGLVDKAWDPTSNRISSISHTKYTIRILNNTLRNADTEVYKNLTTHPVVPADLKLIFLQIQAEGPPMNFGKKELN